MRDVPFLPCLKSRKIIFHPSLPKWICQAFCLAPALAILVVTFEDIQGRQELDLRSRSLLGISGSGSCGWSLRGVKGLSLRILSTSQRRVLSALGAGEISAIVFVNFLGLPSATKKALIHTDKRVCFSCVHDLNVHCPHGKACKQTSIAFHLTASLLDKEGTDIVHIHMDKWWICQSDSRWRELGHNLFTRTSIMLATVNAIRQNPAYCWETTYYPGSLSDEGQNLSRTTMPLLAMTILDDQICYMMFTLENNRVLRLEWNSLGKKRVQVAYWVRPWNALLLVPRCSLTLACHSQLHWKCAVLDSFDDHTFCSHNFADSPLGNAVWILVKEANQKLLETYEPGYGLSKTVSGWIAGQQHFQHFTTDDHVCTTRAFSAFTAILRQFRQLAQANNFSSFHRNFVATDVVWIHHISSRLCWPQMCKIVIWANISVLLEEVRVALDSFI